MDKRVSLRWSNGKEGVGMMSEAREGQWKAGRGKEGGANSLSRSLSGRPDRRGVKVSSLVSDLDSSVK